MKRYAPQPPNEPHRVAGKIDAVVMNFGDDEDTMMVVRHPKTGHYRVWRLEAELETMGEAFREVVQDYNFDVSNTK